MSELTTGAPLGAAAGSPAGLAGAYDAAGVSGVSVPPAISRPSSAAGTSGSRKPVILPSYMTAIRSARA